MISEEEVKKLGKIVGESKNTYTVEKEDGSLVFVCKYCGAELKQNEMFKHFNPRHSQCCSQWLQVHMQQQAEAKQQAKAKKQAEEKKIEQQTVEVKTEKSLTRERILTPEEEMLEEMCRVLRIQMESTPGIGPGQKTDWFVEQYFRSVKTVQENPQELFKQLKKYFPKADDDAISLIVNNVFKVREEYMRKNISTFTPTYNPMMPSTFSPMPQTQFDGNIMFMIFQQMMQQQQQFYQMLLQEVKSRVDPDAIRAQVENEFLKRQVERLEEQVSKLTEMVADSRRVSSEGWRDDYARLIAELGDKVLTLTKEIVTENKNFRKMVIKYLAPKIFGQQQQEFEPKGKTDEEVIAELEKVDLVEEE